MAVARLANLSEVRRYEGGVEVGYHYYWRSKVLSYVYPRMFLIDMVIGYLVSIWPVIALQSKSVVADRYVYDTLVNIAISVGDPEFHNSRLASWFLALVPSQTVTTLLLADADVLKERRADIRHDATMEQKVEQYRRLAADLDIEVVDASNTPGEVQAEIRERVFTDSALS
jgi:thymidylate kinase